MPALTCERLHKHLTGSTNSPGRVPKPQLTQPAELSRRLAERRRCTFRRGGAGAGGWLRWGGQPWIRSGDRSHERGSPLLPLPGLETPRSSPRTGWGKQGLGGAGQSRERASLCCRPLEGCNPNPSALSRAHRHLQGTRSAMGRVEGDTRCILPRQGHCSQVTMMPPGASWAAFAKATLRFGTLPQVDAFFQ